MMVDLEETARQVRRLTLKAIHAARSGHPGGSLSCADVLTQLFFGTMRPQPYRWDDPDRDVFVLSKGHAAPALYSVFHLLGVLTLDELMALRRLGAKAQGHPSYPHLPQVEASSGSLGVAYSVAVGMALERKSKNKPGRVYVLIGDGEMHEGIVAEASRFASFYHLNNLCIILDLNGKQSDEHSKMMVCPLAEFRAWGWHVMAVGGHSHFELARAFEAASSFEDGPTAVLAMTTKGKGVSFYEADPGGGHGSLIIPDEELGKALEELDAKIDLE